MADKGQPKEHDTRGVGGFRRVSPPKASLPRHNSSPPRPDYPGVLEAVWENYAANKKIMDSKPVVDPKRVLEWQQSPGFLPEVLEWFRLEQLLAAKNYINAGAWEGNGYQRLDPPDDIHGLAKKDIRIVEVGKGRLAIEFAAHPGIPKGMGARSRSLTAR